MNFPKLLRRSSKTKYPSAVAAPKPRCGATTRGPKAHAQEILTKGAALFDSKDAAAVAATYAEEGELILIGRNQQTGYDAALKSYSMVQRMSLFQYLNV